MESLNTVIIEGVCTKMFSHCTFADTGEIAYHPWIKVKSKRGDFRVAISFSSYFKGEDDPKYRAVYDNIKPGRGVRVVGALHVDDCGQSKIIAEHIEFKPLFDSHEEEIEE